MYLRHFFALKPFHDYSLCSVCILPQPAFYSSSAVCILHSVCILPLVRSLQSAVRSLHFTLTGTLLERSRSRIEIWNSILDHRNSRLDPLDARLDPRKFRESSLASRSSRREWLSTYFWAVLYTSLRPKIPGGGTRDFKWRGWSKDFFAFEIFDCGIFLGTKIWLG